MIRAANTPEYGHRLPKVCVCRYSAHMDRAAPAAKGLGATDGMAVGSAQALERSVTRTT